MTKITPSNYSELKQEISDFIESSDKKLFLGSENLGIKNIVEETERLLEKKGYKVRVLTKGTAIASVLTMNPLAIGAKLSHLAATYDPDFEIRRNLLNGNIDIVKMKDLTEK